MLCVSAPAFSFGWDLTSQEKPCGHLIWVLWLMCKVEITHCTQCRSCAKKWDFHAELSPFPLWSLAPSLKIEGEIPLVLLHLNHDKRFSTWNDQILFIARQCETVQGKNHHRYRNNVSTFCFPCVPFLLFYFITSGLMRLLGNWKACMLLGVIGWAQIKGNKWIVSPFIGPLTSVRSLFL